eukprot:1921186-Rhodomonas_salina.1
MGPGGMGRPDVGPGPKGKVCRPSLPLSLSLSPSPALPLSRSPALPLSLSVTPTITFHSLHGAVVLYRYAPTRHLVLKLGMVLLQSALALSGTDRGYDTTRGREPTAKCKGSLQTRSKCIGQVVFPSFSLVLTEAMLLCSVLGDVRYWPRLCCCPLLGDVRYRSRLSCYALKLPGDVLTEAMLLFSVSPW